MANAPRPRAFHGVVEQLRAEILSGRRRPGDRLPPERVLADQFAISRGGVREALRALEMQGLVRVDHGYAGGVFVAEPGTIQVLGALQASLLLGQVGVDELYHARLLFEPAIARLAVERSERRSLADRLSANIGRAQARLADGANPFGCNVEFHAILAQAAGNRVVGLVMRALLELLEGLDRQYPTNRAISEAALRDHQQMLEAVYAHEASWVEALMVGHLVRIESRFAEIQAHLDRDRAAPSEGIPSWPGSPGETSPQRSRRGATAPGGGVGHA
jgi:GntR family transcriptional regulator, transcriptional repressor for pyruvate dehydrogenase complex